MEKGGMTSGHGGDRGDDYRYARSIIFNDEDYLLETNSDFPDYRLRRIKNCCYITGIIG